MYAATLSHRYEPTFNVFELGNIGEARDGRREIYTFQYE
jgi:hypothetical protein